MGYLEPIDKMVYQLSRLPGIGKKTAQRLVYYILSLPLDDVQEIASSIWQGKKAIRYCDICGDYSLEELCDICRNTNRKNGQLCVVKDPKDVLAVERMGDYKGEYHVLHGALSPMDGVGPEDIRIKELMQRLKTSSINEVILATNPDIEGEATAMYIARLTKPLGIKTTRIAHGVPIGGNLEYTDEITLSKALEGRREL